MKPGVLALRMQDLEKRRAANAEKSRIAIAKQVKAVTRAAETVESLSVRLEQMAAADMHICFSGRISPEISLTRWIVFRALGEEAEALSAS